MKKIPRVWVVEVKIDREWFPSCTSKASDTKAHGLEDLKIENELFSNEKHRLREYRRVKR